jgi:antitoxin component YwqK of YwqJK toxin-antitoxin module
MRFTIAISFFVFMTVIVQAQTDTLFNQSDARNLKQGWWKKSFPNGKLMYKGYFKDNKPVGELRRYYESGTLKAMMNYDNNGEYARARLFYGDGKPAADGWYFNMLKDSIWCYYSFYDHTITAREVYTKGLRNGLMEHYYNNGSLSEKLTWVNNKKDGPWEQYFADHILKLRGSYREGKLEGEFLVNYEKGKPYLKGGYRNDLREGKWIFYKEDGTKDMELNYRDGKAPDEDKLGEKQKELFHMIDENQGKFEEPDESNFLVPAGR